MVSQRNPPQFLLVSEDSAIVESITQFLKASPFKQAQLTVTISLEHLVQKGSCSAIDLVLLDLAALGKRLLETVKNLLLTQPNLPLLVLYNAQDYAIVPELIQSGVEGLLLKETLSQITVSAALQQVFEQNQNLPSSQVHNNQPLKSVQRLACALDSTLVAVNQLCQRTALLESALMALPDAVVFTDSERRICEVNSAFSQIFDYSLEAVFGQTAELLNESSGAYCTQEKQSYNRRADSSIPVYEARYRRQNGEVFVGETVSTVAKDRAGQILGYFSVIRDITEQKQSEFARQFSQADCPSLYQKAPVMLHSIDSEGRLIYVSNYWLEKLGYARHEVIGRQSADFLTAESRQYAQETILLEYFRAGTCLNIPYQMVAKSGKVIDVVLSAAVERNASGQIVHSLAVMTDVTERNHAVAALKASEARFHTFMNNSPLIAFMKDADSGQLVYVNRTFETFFQTEAAEILGKTDFEWLPLEVAEQNRQHDRQVMQVGQPLQLVESVPDRAGNPQDWLVFKFPCESSNNKSVIGGVAVNITEQKRLEQQLYQEMELAQVTLHSIGDAVITTDAEGFVTYLNPVAENFTGWTQAEAQGLNLSEIFVILNELTRELIESPVSLVLREGTTMSLANHAILVAKDGSERSIEDSAAPIQNSDGKIVGTVLVFHDVTESRQLARQLTWQAGHDELTQLANRRQFEQVLSEFLHRPHESGVLCFLDLDQFKLVNDACGHPAGDELLRQVSDILSRQVRVTDTVARLGGDEFAILLHQCSLEFARRIANLMCQSIRELRFISGEQSFSVGASMGLVEITQDAQQSLSEVLAAADAACYAAKEAGRNRVHVYRTDDLGLSRQRNQQQWCLRIDQALEEDRFQLYHQPIVAVDSSEGMYYRTELLLRLLDRQGQIIAPMAFIPAAERYHRMPAIDQWVIQRFLAEVELSSEADSPIHYNINLSGASLNDKNFLNFLKYALSNSAVDPTLLCFEVTETAAISNLHRVTAFMNDLKQLGCQFALDDFGSGMSSFGYLRQLPVDYLKIDGSFVKKLDDPINSAIVGSICNIGQAMNIQVIAEWVEDEVARAQLQKLGVDYVQGYGVAEPAPFSLIKIDSTLGVSSGVG